MIKSLFFVIVSFKSRPICRNSSRSEDKNLQIILSHVLAEAQFYRFGNGAGKQIARYIKSPGPVRRW